MIPLNYRLSMMLLKVFPMLVSTQTRSFVNDFLKVGVLNPDYFRAQNSQRDSNAEKTEKHIQMFTRTNDRGIRAAVTPPEHDVKMS